MALNSTFYHFGGVADGAYSGLIASFDTITFQWKKLGGLINPRGGHKVIIQQDQDSHVDNCHPRAKFKQNNLLFPSLVI